MQKSHFGKSHVSFHTPGHSGEAYKGRDFFLSDVTELSYTDNLLSPTGEILELEKKLASLYGTDFALISCNGATTCVAAAAAAMGGTCLVIGGAHRSLFNAVRGYGGSVVVTRDLSVAGKYLENNTVDYVFVTYPDYLGRDLGIENISEFCREHSLPLVIDSAHGSHFAFNGNSAVSATEYGDLVIYSLHKTLPVLTGGALLTGKAEYKSKAFFELTMRHSTSPSYMILESIAAMVDDIDKVKDGYTSLSYILEDFRADVIGTGRFGILPNTDPCRVVITAPDGYRLAAYLEDNDVYPETAFNHGVVLIATPYNMKHLGLVAELLRRAPVYPPCDMVDAPTPELKRVDYYKTDYEEVDLESALGRRLFSEIGVYPPGVPSYFFGDVIDERFVAFYRDYENFLFGTCNGKLFVIK